MSVVLVPCPNCTDGYEYYPFGDDPFTGSKVTCWTCGGERMVPEMLSREEMAEFIAGDHGQDSA